MTLALLAFALLVWPAGGDGRRIARLAADGRLAAPPRFTRSVGRSWIGGRLPPVALGALGAAVAGLVAGSRQGTAAAAEFATCAAVTVAIVLALVRRGVQARRQASAEARVLIGVSLLAAELAAGAAPDTALVAAGPVGIELARRLAPGTPAADGSDGLARVVTAWRMSADSGVALVEVLVRVRADLAASAAGRRDLATAVAGPRASAVLLALLPVLGVGLGGAVGAQPLVVLFETSIGRALLCGGLMLDALGLLWTDLLIARAQR